MRESLSWRNSMKIDELKTLKSGNAEPYARKNEGNYRRGGWKRGDLCPWLFQKVAEGKTSYELSWRADLDYFKKKRNSTTTTPGIILLIVRVVVHPPMRHTGMTMGTLG